MTFAQAANQLRAAGVEGPYSAVLSAEAYTAVSEASDHGYPVIRHLRNVLDGELVWAPSIAGAVVLTARGGDFSLHLGQDLSIGYQSHTDADVMLYLQESMTFQVLTAEAAVRSLPLTSLGRERRVPRRFQEWIFIRSDAPCQCHEGRQRFEHR